MKSPDVFSKSSISDPAAASGFTLLEILVAIFLFSILITVLFGSFRFISSSTDSLGRGADEIEMGRHCISWLTSDMSNIKVTLATEFKNPDLRDTEDAYRLVGSKETIDSTVFSQVRFTSASHISFDETPDGGVAEIVYYIHQVDDSECVLRRSDQLYPFETFEAKNTDPVICKNVLGFSLAYYDDEGEETDEWDSESSEFDYGTPRSIGIVLTIGSEETQNSFSDQVWLPVYRDKQS
jgi:general secretion pathway protein J